MRTLVIGDIHGCLRALTTLLNAVVPRPDDLLITLGDYVDRGPDSKGVLDYLVDLHATGRLVALRGNHDQMMCDARAGLHRVLWLGYGGAATLASYGIEPALDADMSGIPESHWEFLNARCVNWYELPHHVFVHGSVVPRLPMAEQPLDVLHWDKVAPGITQPHCSGKTMICGHTRQSTGQILDLGHAICIDTNVYGRGWLTCLEIDNYHWWQANQAGESRTGVLRGGP